jgi:hypothetical protein
MWAGDLRRHATNAQAGRFLSGEFRSGAMTMRYPVFLAAAILLAAAPAFAQSTPETAAPAGPSVAPVTGSSTVGQPGTPRTAPRAHYHHIIRRTAHHRHHRLAHRSAAAATTSSGTPPPQDSSAGAPPPH